MERIVGFLSRFVVIFGAIWTMLEAAGFFKNSWAKTLQTWNDGAGLWVLVGLSGLFAALSPWILAKISLYALEAVDILRDGKREGKELCLTDRSKSKPTNSRTFRRLAPFDKIKIQTLERRLARLSMDYQKASDQLDAELGEVNRLRLKRQLSMLEEEIRHVQNELNPFE